MNARFLGRAALMSGLLACGIASAATTTIDFNAVALRGANAEPHAMANITEYANGNGASVTDTVAGQKSYYGTSYFDGASVGSVSAITFSYKPTAGAAPYVNFAVTNGSTWGVLTTGFGVLPTLVNNGDGSFTATYDFTGASWRLVEIAGAASGFGNNDNLSFSDIASWSFVSGDRQMAPAETAAFGDPKGPVSDGLAIMWGDTSNNYLGEVDIFDVTVTGLRGEEFVAGNVNAVPEPASLALVGAALLGLAASRRRRS